MVHPIEVRMKRTALGLLLVSAAIAVLLLTVDSPAEALAQGGQKVGLVV